MTLFLTILIMGCVSQQEVNGFVESEGYTFEQGLNELKHIENTSTADKVYDNLKIFYRDLQSMEPTRDTQALLQLVSIRLGLFDTTVLLVNMNIDLNTTVTCNTKSDLETYMDRNEEIAGTIDSFGNNYPEFFNQTNLNPESALTIRILSAKINETIYPFVEDIPCR